MRRGAQRIIQQAVEAKLKVCLDEHAAERDTHGRQAVVHNGYQPEREVLTGIGAVKVQVPQEAGSSGRRRCFRAELLPLHLKEGAAAC